MSSMRAGSLAMLPAGGRHRDWADGQDSAQRTAEVATVGRGRAGTHGVLQTHIYLACAGKRNIILWYFPRPPDKTNVTTSGIILIS